MINADTPANPTGYATAFEGLTKREYFAGLAMQGLLCGGYCIDMPKNRAADVTSESLVLADALLAELDK